MVTSASAEDGLIELNVKEIRPPKMDDSGRTKYPVLFRVYVLFSSSSSSSPTSEKYFLGTAAPTPKRSTCASVGTGTNTLRVGWNILSLWWMAVGRVLKDGS